MEEDRFNAALFKAALGVGYAIEHDLDGSTCVFRCVSGTLHGMQFDGHGKAKALASGREVPDPWSFLGLVRSV